MNTPNPINLYIGAGEVFFDRFDASGNPTGLRHLGNVDNFGFASKVEVADKKTSMSGLRAILAEVPKGFSGEISLEMSEFDTDNLALALLGTSAIYTQAASGAVTAQPINGGVAIVLDTWYELGFLQMTVTAFKQGATTLDAQAYEFKADVGMVRFKSSYTGVNAATAAITTWDGSYPAILAAAKKTVVQALAVSKIQGRLKYVSAADQANGPRIMVDVWKTNLFPDGDLSLISEDFASFKLKGQSLPDATKAAGQQYMKVTYL
jgi:hypothetical protein